MAPPLSTTSVQVGTVVFPPSIKAPGTTTTLFLGGAGLRGVEIQGKFVNVSVSGVYLEDKAIPSLAVKWKGKTAAELTDSVHFYRDIIKNGPFEKLILVEVIVPVVGMEHAQTMSKLCVAIWKAEGTYTDADSATIAKYLEAFEGQNLSPGSCILYTITPAGLLMISFAKDGIIPETPVLVLETKKLGQALLECVFGEKGVSPEAKQSLASRLADLMN